MISFIRGKISTISEHSAIVDVAGIGYQVSAPARVLRSLTVGTEVIFHVHHYIREDRQDLFGFLDRDELAFFEKLISISGIGPRTALAIMEVATLDALADAVYRGDSSLLMKVSGVGRKTAERVVVELKGKVIAPAFESATGIGGDSDVFAALEQLGYSSNQIRQVVADLDSSLTTEAKIKSALKQLSRA